MTQGTEYLPSKCKALSLRSSTEIWDFTYTSIKNFFKQQEFSVHPYNHRTLNYRH
jgi:hypothetical protein